MNNQIYFSEKEKGLKSRIEEEINSAAWGGIVTIIDRDIKKGFFSEAFPAICAEYQTAIIGTDLNAMGMAIEAEIPELIITKRVNIGWDEDVFQNIKEGWPLSTKIIPPTMVILDLIEFCHKYISEPTKRSHHSHFRHEHLSNYDKELGQSTFCENINVIFRRNGLVYELEYDGCIRRLIPPVLRETLTRFVFQTGESTLDELLEDARFNFLSPDPKTRRESLQKLWDAWERLKTLELPDKTKKESVSALLERASYEPNFRDRLNNESIALTHIGNDFQIRHTEVGKISIDSMEHVDYLFHRLFALIYLLLRKKIK